MSLLRGLNPSRQFTNGRMAYSSELKTFMHTRGTNVGALLVSSPAYTMPDISGPGLKRTQRSPAGCIKYFRVKFSQADQRAQQGDVFSGRRRVVNVQRLMSTQHITQACCGPGEEQETTS